MTNIDLIKKLKAKSSFNVEDIFIIRMNEEGHGVDYGNVNCFSEDEMYRYLDNMGWGFKS